jgi:hypothetical protein
MSLFSDRNPLPDDSNNLENVLIFISGIIKGVLSAFNLDSTVIPAFKPAPIIASLITNTIGQVNPSQSIFSYSFNITLLNINI